jgi:hypothetical protein
MLSALLRPQTADPADDERVGCQAELAARPSAIGEHRVAEASVDELNPVRINHLRALRLGSLGVRDRDHARVPAAEQTLGRHVGALGQSRQLALERPGVRRVDSRDAGELADDGGQRSRLAAVSVDQLHSCAPALGEELAEEPCVCLRGGARLRVKRNRSVGDVAETIEHGCSGRSGHREVPAALPQTLGQARHVVRHTAYLWLEQLKYVTGPGRAMLRVTWQVDQLLRRRRRGP